MPPKTRRISGKAPKASTEVSKRAQTPAPSSHGTFAPIALLVAQNVGVVRLLRVFARLTAQVALIRHTRTSGRAEERYTAATAVVVTEVVKFLMALAVVVYQRRANALQRGDRSSYLSHAARAVGALVAPAQGSSPWLMMVPSALCALLDAFSAD